MMNHKVLKTGITLAIIAALVLGYIFMTGKQHKRPASAMRQPLPVAEVQNQEIDPAYEEELKEKNRRFAEAAAKTGGDATPTPTSCPSKAIKRQMGSTVFFNSGISNPAQYGAPKEFEKFEKAPTIMAAEEPVSTFAADVDTASYNSVQRMAMAGRLPQKTFIHVEELINYFNYDYPPAKSVEEPFQPTVAVYPSPWNENAKLIHIGIKGFEPKPEDSLNRAIFTIKADIDASTTNDEMQEFVEHEPDKQILLSEQGFCDDLPNTAPPIATDVTFQVEFNPARVKEYRFIGYETRKMAREDSNNDKVDAGDIGAGHTVTAIYEYIPAGSKSGWVDENRYSQNAAEAPESETGFSDEIAFLKMRYKLPKEDTSRLITRPITTADAAKSVDDISADMRFAASVAAFGQKLRGGEYTGDFSWDDVRALGQSGLGEDTQGLRKEYIEMLDAIGAAEEKQQIRDEIFRKQQEINDLMKKLQ